MTGHDGANRGAYGFRLIYEDLTDPLPDLVEVDESAPIARVSWRQASVARSFVTVEEDRVAFGTRGGAAIHVQRSPASIWFDLEEPPVPAAFVHPLLTVPASILARWRGDLTLHAGAFETSAGAWAMMGERAAGKSSTLAAIAEKGFPIVADDLVLVNDGYVWAGPSCVDLRPDAVRQFPSARYLGNVAKRDRYRLSTTPARSRIPLRGFFFLGWNEGRAAEAQRVPARDLLLWLYRQEYIGLMGPVDPKKLMELLPLPAWEVRRPPGWSSSEGTVERILEIATGGLPH